MVGLVIGLPIVAEQKRLPEIAKERNLRSLFYAKISMRWGSDRHLGSQQRRAKLIGEDLCPVLRVT
jgi:hypothetical protein